MSCIRITTDAMRTQLLAAVRDDEPVAQFLSPQVTESKVRRLEKLARDINPKIRESVALSYHAPESVYWALSDDPVASVRECLARNHVMPEAILRKLATDKEDRVRAFVASNTALPEDVREQLKSDPIEVVRLLAAFLSAPRQP